jgi:glycerol uptake facilitator protein
MAGRQFRSGMVAELSSEFAGTMVLILFGCGVVAQVVVGAGTLGNHDSISWAWGFGVAFGIYVAGRLSGAHINPAVTLAFACFEKFPWRKVLPYMVAQLLGAFVGALLVRWNYTETLAKVDPHHTFKTQFVFSTLPGNGTLPVSELGALRDQIIGTAILLLVISAIIDMKNTKPGANLHALMIGLLVVAIGMAYGADAGYAINPARDLGPRLASFFTGYSTAWRDQFGNFYWWVPIVGPLIGGPLGAALYRLFISQFLPVAEQQEVGQAGQRPT